MPPIFERRPVSPVGASPVCDAPSNASNSLKAMTPQCEDSQDVSGENNHWRTILYLLTGWDSCWCIIHLQVAHFPLRCLFTGDLIVFVVTKAQGENPKRWWFRGLGNFHEFAPNSGLGILTNLCTICYFKLKSG